MFASGKYMRSWQALLVSCIDMQTGVHACLTLTIDTSGTFGVFWLLAGMPVELGLIPSSYMLHLHQYLADGWTY
jgi:hypothetical protein